MRHYFCALPVDSLVTDDDTPLSMRGCAALGYGGGRVMCFILARYGMQGLFRCRQRALAFSALQFRGGFGVNQPWRILAAWSSELWR